jgi:GAF domain-containing protein/anti-sigma regulatory factor (Ser/Thr protein kinase)
MLDVTRWGNRRAGEPRYLRVLIDEELHLAGDPIAVSQARQFVRTVMTDQAPDLVDDVELAMSELVTNAVLHTDSDIMVRLLSDDRQVRIEVYDGSAASPLRIRPGIGSTTGRGLALVGSLASNWGVDSGPAGKVIWAEIGSTTEGRIVSEPDSTTVRPTHDVPRPSPGSAPVDVYLGEVPTDLLVQAKEHLDNLVRELELAEFGASSGLTQAIPGDMVDLIDTVLGEFADVRRSIKEQAARALAEGRPRTSLTLRIPVSTADAGEAYLEALERADKFAHASRLLTLATPPQHRAFRRWYVHSLIQQLRAAARGEPVPQTPSFEEHLLNELAAVRTAQQSSEMLAARLAHLQELTAELTDATDVGDIADVFVSHATEAFGAEFVAVYELSGDLLTLLRTRGLTLDQLLGWDMLPVDADVPACVAVREGRVETVTWGEDLEERYPDLPDQMDDPRSIMCAPMRVGGRTLGVIALTLDIHRDVTDPQETAFLASLAHACAQAMDRARALMAERRTADKLEVLAAASAELVAAGGQPATLDSVVELLVPRFADWAWVRTTADSRLGHGAITHADPNCLAAAEKQQVYDDVSLGLADLEPHGDEGARLVPVVTDAMLADVVRDDRHLELLHAIGLRSLIVTPLVASGHKHGTLTMAYGTSGRRYSEEDLPFAEDLGHRTALAIEQAVQFQAQTGRLATITRIAEAAQHAILADVPDRVGSVRLAGSYVSAAREALIGGDMFEVVLVPGGVRLLVGDARGKGLDAVRLATVVLGFFRSAAAEPMSLAGLAWQMDRRLTPYLDDEDFVTTVMVEIDRTGHCQVVSCGHPFPLLFTKAGMQEVECPVSLPLGLDAQPRTVHLDLEPGDRLLLYTDGLVEARNADGDYADLSEVAAPLQTGDLRTGLDDVLARLRTSTREDLDDDLSLLVAEFLPEN